MTKQATLQSISELMAEHANTLNEYFYHLTADYRKNNPEANEAFFEQYPEMKQYKEQD